jgi:hypothetical protein
MLVALAGSGVNEPLVNLAGIVVGVGSLALTLAWLAYLYRD